MSDDSQISPKTLTTRFLTEEERELFGFLEQGSRTYSEICKHLELKGLSKSKANRLLNKNVRKNRLFRIKKGKNVFYRINDFPLNVNTLLAFIDSSIKERERKIADYREERNKSDIFNVETHKFELEKSIRQVFETHFLTQELKEYQTLKNNIIFYYPKLDLRNILRLTLVEIGASTSENTFTKDFLERLKATLD